MLIYEKDNHLYYSQSGVPAVSDVQLSYKKASDGSAISGVSANTYAYEKVKSLFLNVTTKNQVPTDDDIDFTVWAGDICLFGVPTLIVTPASIEVVAGSTADITVSNAAGVVSVTSSDTAVATAELSGSTITVNGVAEGSATLTITDGVTTKTVNVTVGAAMSISPESINFENTGSEGSPEVKTVTISDAARQITLDDLTYSESAFESQYVPSISGNTLTISNEVVATGANFTITITDGTTTCTLTVTADE